jgi:hypothetical protein
VTVGTVGDHTLTVQMPSASATTYAGMVAEAMNSPQPVGHLRFVPEEGTEVLIGLRDVVVFEVSDHPPPAQERR